MNGFLYGVALQWKLDLRSRTMLITCYAERYGDQDHQPAEICSRMLRELCVEEDRRGRIERHGDTSG